VIKFSDLRWFSPELRFFPAIKTDRHDKTEIMLKVVLSIIILTLNNIYTVCQDLNAGVFVCMLISYKVCQWLLAGRLLSPASPTNNTDRHDITDILLKVALNTMILTL
jgi:hypothetical protein